MLTGYGSETNDSLKVSCSLKSPNNGIHGVDNVREQVFTRWCRHCAPYPVYADTICGETPQLSTQVWVELVQCLLYSFEKAEAVCEAGSTMRNSKHLHFNVDG